MIRMKRYWKRQLWQRLFDQLYTFSGPVTAEPNFKDFKDSSYVAFYNVTVSGKYSIRIESGDSVLDKALIVKPAESWAGTSYINSSMLSVTAGVSHYVELTVRDIYSNILVAPETESEITSIECTIIPDGPAPVNAKDGRFVFTDIITQDEIVNCRLCFTPCSHPITIERMADKIPSFFSSMAHGTRESAMADSQTTILTA